MTDEKIDIKHLRSWIGKQERATDVLTPELINRYKATLGTCTTLAESQVPLGIHWCLAQPTALQQDLGVDGHPARGGFLPPVPLPRRMWAASKLQFFTSAKAGASIERTSTVTDVVMKNSAKSGALVFVRLDHEYLQKTRDSSEALLNERQTVVYKEQTTFQKPDPELHDAAACALSLVPDSRLLFRYSALTFNAHRIHYDHDYTVTEEGYPGLIVHGPLIATLVMNLAQTRASTKPLHSFEFQALSPAFVDQPLHITSSHDNGDFFEIRNQDNASIMKATAHFAASNDKHSI